MTSPIVRCTLRLELRNFTLIVRTMKMMSGVIASESSVNFQFSHNIQPRSPMEARPSLKMIVSTFVAAVVTCETSNVTFEIRLPVGRLS